MLERVQTDLQICRLSNRDLPILVGVSGGPDSLALMDILHSLQYNVVVAHFNHRLRAEAGDDVQAVAMIARELGLPFLSGEGEVRDYATTPSLSLEEAARLLRYRFLFEQAGSLGAQAVAVGHTADDQVETVLMHLLRGAGLSGLRGMACRSLPNAWSEQIPLVRPLLGVWRSEVMDWLNFRGLQPRFDASNLDTRYYRNRLRYELVPFLASYNPQVRERLWQMARALSGDLEVIEGVINAAWERCVVAADQQSVVFDLGAFREEPVGVQRRLLRRAIARLQPGLRDVDFESIERALSGLESGPGRYRCDLVGGLRWIIVQERAWVTGQADIPVRDAPQILPGRSYPLKVPGRLTLSPGWELQAEPVEDLSMAQRAAIVNVDPFQSWIALDGLEDSLRVRGRRAGERFQPLGMDGHSLKLSDFMINVKIPQPARDDWPLVVSGETVVWVPGFQLAHPYRLQPETRLAAHLSLRRAVPPS